MLSFGDGGVPPGTRYPFAIVVSHHVAQIWNAPVAKARSVPRQRIAKSAASLSRRASISWKNPGSLNLPRIRSLIPLLRPEFATPANTDSHGWGIVLLHSFSISPFYPDYLPSSRLGLSCVGELLRALNCSLRRQHW